MSWSEILVAFGGVAGIAGALAVFAKFVAEKSTEAALKRFEHSLRIAEKDHEASLKRSEAEFNARLNQVAKEHDWSLKRLEAEYGSSLKRVEESHKASVTFASALDAELRTQRTKAYAVLWCMTGKLPQWPRDEKLQYSDLPALSEHLRDWYFQTGGIYLSGSARQVYSTVQEAIQVVLASRKTGLVETPDYESIRKACSALRTELTKDLLSRREPPSLPEEAKG